jgi:hypothetical protein
MATKPQIVRVSLSYAKIGKTKQIDLEFVCSGYKIFFNCQHIFLKLNPIQRSFFDYLCEHMYMSNSILIDVQLKSNFQQFLEDITSKGETISISALDKYIPKLVSLKLLIRTNTIGEYFVNPKYVFKGSAVQREIQIIKLFKEAESGTIDINSILDRPLDDYFPEI